MNYRSIFTSVIAVIFLNASCNSQKTSEEQQEPKTYKEPDKPIEIEPHSYGGWYCPDNFGFIPVDIHKLHEVPAIMNRLPTKEELKEYKSLIEVDTIKYPHARAMKMDLPRVASIKAQNSNNQELIIVIQAFIIGEDTIVGYRFPSGGNGSARLKDVSFLTTEEVKIMGPQPFFYSRSSINASKDDIWAAVDKTDYGRQLAIRFKKENLFSADWQNDSWPHIKFEDDMEKINGYVGMVFGNLYLQIDYRNNNIHYTEKMLMIENHENNTTELFFASGPFPKNFDEQESSWNNWLRKVSEISEGR